MGKVLVISKFSRTPGAGSFFGKRGNQLLMKFLCNREMVVSRGLWCPNKELFMWNVAWPQNSNKPDTKVRPDFQPETRKIILSDLRLSSLPLFTTWWSHTDQKLITSLSEKRTETFNDIVSNPFSIKFIPPCVRAVTRRLVWFGVPEVFVSNPTPRQLLSFESHLFPQSQLTSSYSFFFPSPAVWRG